MISGRGRWRALACSICLLIAGCASTEPSPVATALDLPIPDSTSTVQQGDLRISPLDVLDIKVFGAPQLDGSYQVDPSGQIKVPLVGVMSAKGYTIFEMASILEQKLGESYLQNPQVSVRISELYGQQVTVEGSIKAPGVYPVRGAMTLLQAIAVSGGPTEMANPRRVIIFRTIEGERKAAAFDLLKIRAGSAPDPSVYGNDIIVVDGSAAKSGYDEFLRSIPILGLFMAIG